MFKYRVIKLITVLTLAVCCLLCNTVYSFAYFPAVKISADDFHINSDSTFKAVYPDRIGGFNFVDSVYSVSEHNDDTYFVTNYGVDESIDISVDITFDNSPISYNDNTFAMYFRINSFMFILYFSDINAIDEFHIEDVIDSNGYTDYFNFKYILNSTCRVKLYQSGYPFTSWSKIYDVNNTGSSLNTLQTRKWFDYVSEDNFYMVYF